MDHNREDCCRRNLPSENALVHQLHRTMAALDDVIECHGGPDCTCYLCDDLRGLNWVLSMAESILTSNLLAVPDETPLTLFVPSEN